MATTNLTQSGTHTEIFRESLCSPLWLSDFKQQSISLSAVNILLPITVILGNTLIIIALHKESSLHPPYKLLYQCLATTDLLVGLVIHPPMLPTGCPWFTKTGVFLGLWYSILTIPSGLVISVVSYTKTFRAFGHHQVEIQDHVQQRLSQPNALNMAWYRKAVYNALWVQLALVVRYVPQITVRIVIYLSAKRFGVSC